MEIFWRTIAYYNSATWLLQIIVILIGIVLTPPQSYRLRRRFVVQHNIETIVCIRIFALVLKSRLSYN